MSSLHDIVRQARTLNHEQLGELRRAIGAMLSVTSNSGNSSNIGSVEFEEMFAGQADDPTEIQTSGVSSWSNADNDESMVLDVVAEVLRAKRGEQVAIGLILRQKNVMAAVRSKLPGLLAFVRAAVAHRIDRRALLVIGVELLYQDMTQLRQAVSAQRLLAELGRIPALFERHFPGYAKAGLLHWVLRRKP